MSHLIRNPLEPFSVYGYCRGGSRIYTQDDLLGHWSVLFFYPADFSFVCPTELKDMGEHYDDFMAVYSDSDAREENRKITVSDFVNLNGLEFKYYQDEGWDPVELYPAAE